MPSVPSPPTIVPTKSGPGDIVDWTADLHNLAVGRHHFQPQHVIHCDAILQRVRTAGVCRNVAADRARPLARRIRRIVKTSAREPAVQMCVHNARLDHRVTIAEIHFTESRASA